MQRITNNWSLKLIALVLAVLLWSHVRGEVNPLEASSVDVPLKVQPPRGMVLLNPDEMPSKVTVTLRGPRLALRNIKGGGLANPLAPTEQAPNVVEGAVEAIVDFSKFKSETRTRVTEQEVPIKAETDDANRRLGVEVLGVKPDEVSVVLDRSRNARFSVQPRFEPGPELGFRVANLRVRPGSAEAYGPSKALTRISAVWARTNGRVFKRDIERVTRATLVAVDNKGGAIGNVRLEPGTVEVAGILQEDLIMRRVPLAARLTGAPAAGYHVTGIILKPARITLSGPRQTLEGLKAVSVPLDVSRGRTTIRHHITPKLPESMTVLDKQQVLAIVHFARVAPGPLHIRKTPPD
jgi:YbbR domain-containing protein